MTKPKSKIVKKIEARVTKSKVKSGKLTASSEEQHELGSVSSDTPLCNVGFSAGFTKDIGGYNSARVQVSLHIPCSFDDIEKTYKYGREWVDNKVGELWSEIE